MPATVLQLSASKGGVPKLPLLMAEVGKQGLNVDGHDNPHIHGGPVKAVLIITSEGIEELKQSGFLLFFGALGENITTQGLDRRTVRIGQRYRIGEIILRITRLRQPCDTLSVYGPGIQKAVYDQDVQAGDADSPRWGLGGFYAAVERTGTIRPGDPIELLNDKSLT